MAKKKIEAEKSETPVITVQDPNENIIKETAKEEVETAEKPDEENGVKEGVGEKTEAPVVEEKPKTKKQKETAAPAIEDIPDNVKGILKVFNNYLELYVSATGRVFTVTSKPSLRGNAILYKNPFYNSKS